MRHSAALRTSVVLLAALAAVHPLALRASAQEAPPEAPPDAASSAEDEELAAAEAAAAEEAAALEAAAAEEAAALEAELAADVPHCTGTGVEGVVRDAATQETLIEAPVLVVGRGTRVLTDYDGNYAIDLPPGTYTLRSYYDLYEPTRVENVVVTRGQCTRVDLSLSSEAMQGQEVVIEIRAERGTTGSQLRARREAAATQDSVSREEMARAPDSTAAEAARRIVGVTLRDDYVYVRGLGGRYVATLMNGVALPQTDPDVPGVQLDILPSALLESLTIRKTFTADMPGDWAGGLVDVGTQSFPTDFQLRVGASFGVNTAISFQDSLGYAGGSTDFLGVDDGTRQVPEAIRGVIVPGDREQREAAALEFPNTWALLRRTALPNMGLTLSMGDTLDVGGHLLGYRVLAGYRTGERPIPDFIQTLRGGDEGVDIRETLSQDGSERYVQLSVLGTATLELERGHELTLNALFSQNAEDYTGRVRGMSEAVGANIDQYRLQWIQRSLFFGQLLGEHRDILGPAHLDWQLNVGVGERQQPDMRDLGYVEESDGRYRYTSGPTSGNRFYSDLDDISYGGGLNLTIPIDQVTVRVGGLYRGVDRALAIRRFTWLTQSRAPDTEGYYMSGGELFSPQRVNTYLRLTDQTTSDDSYDAMQQLVAGYVAAEWRPWSLLRLFGGVRAESFRQEISSFLPVGEPMPVLGTSRTDLDALPSVGAVVELTTGLFARAGYTGTVARPQIRELAPFAFVDYLRRRTVTGQPDLRRTYIHNFDLRLEWFPSETEVLAVSVFGKLFESPIEQVIVSAEGDASFDNVDGADNFGVEAEARVHLGHFFEGADWISLGANVAFIYSRARLSLEQQRNATSAERPLAGQAPWVINAGIGFAPPGTGLTANIYYNVLGSRLEDVGRIPLPDVYREPLHQVDVTIGWEFADSFQLRFSAQNILFQRQELRQGDYVVLAIDPGAQFSLGLSVSN